MEKTTRTRSRAEKNRRPFYLRAAVFRYVMSEWFSFVTAPTPRLGGQGNRPLAAEGNIISRTIFKIKTIALYPGGRSQWGQGRFKNPRHIDYAAFIKGAAHDLHADGQSRLRAQPDRQGYAR